MDSMEVTYNTEKKWRILSWSWKCTKRRRPPTDSFFEEGDIVCNIAAKQLPLEHVEEKAVVSITVPEFVCSMTRCNKMFDSVVSYEAHYNSAHRNVCSTCGRSLPSSHLLDLHILEDHDSMFEILASKQNMYGCLVEECKDKFPSPKERKDHLVRVHHYPSNFRFQKGKKATRQQKAQGSADTPDAMQVDPTDITYAENTSKPSDEVKENVEPVVMTNNPGLCGHGNAQSDKSAPRGRVFSYKVPQTICFGQGSTRGFHIRGRRGQRGRKGAGKPRHWHQQNVEMEADTSVNIETVKMDDLVSALEPTL